VVCKTCHTEKPLEDFHRIGTGKDSSCKPCRHRKQMDARRGKFAAQRAVQNAVKRGSLVRPERCEDCGLPGALHGHHEDYSRKLDVQWLCASCHRRRHPRPIGAVDAAA
jgi:hypothetical protein